MLFLRKQNHVEIVLLCMAGFLTQTTHDIHFQNGFLSNYLAGAHDISKTLKTNIDGSIVLVICTQKSISQTNVTLCIAFFPEINFDYTHEMRYKATHKIIQPRIRFTKRDSLFMCTSKVSTLTSQPRKWKMKAKINGIASCFAYTDIGRGC